MEFAARLLVPTRRPVLFLARITQYRADLHCGHTLNSFRWPTALHPSLWQYLAVAAQVEI